MKTFIVVIKILLYLLGFITGGIMFKYGNSIITDIIGLTLMFSIILNTFNIKYEKEK